MYQGVQGACPQQAVTSARVTAERHDVGMGLKLVIVNKVVMVYDLASGNMEFEIAGNEKQAAMKSNMKSNEKLMKGKLQCKLIWKFYGEMKSKLQWKVI